MSDSTKRYGTRTIISFALAFLLTLGACASLEHKCIRITVGDGARADLTIGAYASVALRGPGTYQSIPKDASNDCASRFDPSFMAPAPKRGAGDE